MLQQLWAEKLWALHLNLWKPLSPRQREIGSVDNPNIFNFVLSDTEEMCQHWGPTASKHRSLTSNNLDSTSPPVLSHRRSATFISFRSRSVDQKRRLSSLNKKQQHCKCFHGHSLVSLVGCAWVSAGCWLVVPLVSHTVLFVSFKSQSYKTDCFFHNPSCMWRLAVCS